MPSKVVPVTVLAAVRMMMVPVPVLAPMPSELPNDRGARERAGRAGVDGDVPRARRFEDDADAGDADRGVAVVDGAGVRGVVE